MVQEQEEMYFYLTDFVLSNVGILCEDTLEALVNYHLIVFVETHFAKNISKSFSIIYLFLSSENILITALKRWLFATRYLSTNR